MKLTLLKIKEEVENVTSFIFKSDSTFTFKAGQFLRYYIKELNKDNRGENRFYSIASPPHEEHIMLTTKFSSNLCSTFKKDLQRLEIGDSIEAFGPYGSHVIEDPSKKYFFIAGGIGITPFRSIILDLDFRKLPINITLLYANRNESIVFKEELEEIAGRTPSFKIHYLIGTKHIDEEIIKSTALNLKDYLYYISGPEPMVLMIENLLESLGVSEEKIRRDYFVGYETI